MIQYPNNYHYKRAQKQSLLDDLSCRIWSQMDRDNLMLVEVVHQIPDDVKIFSNSLQ